MSTCYLISIDTRFLPLFTAIIASLSDQASDVTCSVNYMRIEMPRSVFNSSKYSDISLLDKSCKASFSDSKIILDSAPHLCGSNRIETKDHIIYQNEVYMTAIPTGKLVTREHDVRIAFSCHYDKLGYLSLESFKPQTIIDIKEGICYSKLVNLQLEETACSPFSKKKFIMLYGEKIADLS